MKNWTTKMFFVFAMLGSTSAFAAHKGFHLECQKGASPEKALTALHAVFHTYGNGVQVPGHGLVDVESVSAPVLTKADGGSHLACATVTWHKDHSDAR